MPKRLSFKEKQTILRFSQSGLKDAEVALKAGCSRQTVARLRKEGIVTDRTTKGRVYQVRVSKREADAFDELLRQQDMSASEMLRRMIRLAEGVVDFRAEEVAALHQSSNQLNALARNLVQMLQLAHVGKLKWNARDSRLVAQLADRTEQVARATQSLKAAAMRGAFTKSSELAKGLANG